MKNFKIYIILLLLLLLYISICSISYVNAINSNISNEIFRLHVIANSNNNDDQYLKYLVRDNVLEHINSKNFTSKQDLINYLNNNIDNIERIANDTILKNGYLYNANVEIGNFNFPTKNYGDISFPAGNYDGLKINLGNSEGQNWWCVMFPPLCFVDISSGVVDENSKQLLENNLTEEEYALISNNDDITIQFKFKLFELFNNFNPILANR